MNTRVLDLKSLFELRKTHPLKPRRSVGRLFVCLGRWGLADATGALWPLELTPAVAETPLKTGDVVDFLGHFHRQNTQQMAKYDDEGFSLQIQAITEVIEDLLPFRHPKAHVVSPENILPDIEKACLRKAHVGGTLFFPTSTSLRWSRLNQRALALDRIRHFFQNRGFVHVDTPTLVPSGSMERYLNTFSTEYQDHRGNIWKLELPTSPEFALKKLLTEGPGRLFQISRSWRNGGELSKWHEPEFLMLEWYRVGAHLGDMQLDTQELVHALNDFLGQLVEIPLEWPVFQVTDLFEKHVGLSLKEHQDTEVFRKAAAPLSLSIVPTDTWDDIFFKLFFERIEPVLSTIPACFVSGYPSQMSALARRNPDGITCARMEAYLFGVEICNAYHELVDSKELSDRKDQIANERTLAGDVIFERHMAHGLPPCSGNALGLERVMALLLGLPSLAPLLPQPFLSRFMPDTVAPL